MPLPPFAAEAMPVAPALMLVVGLVILVAGLVLLTGGGLRRRDEPVPAAAAPGTAPAAPSPATAPAPAPTVAEPDVAAPAAPPAAVGPDDCDWGAWLELDGDRVALRTPTGRACCTYTLRVRDLDDVLDPVDALEEVLVWSGEATELGPDGAATPLQRDVVTRRASSSAGASFAALSLDRSPGPVVRTAGWRDVPAADLAATGDLDTRAAQLWALHLDELRKRGARTAPAGTPRVAPVVHRRRVEATVTVVRGCTPAPHGATVDGHCRAELGASVAPAAGHLETPLLASWVDVDGTITAADQLLAPSTGLSGWHPVDDEQGAGVAAACDRVARTTAATWGRDLHAEVDEARTTVVLGSAVRLDVEADEHVRTRVAAELHASTGAHVTVRLGAPDPTGNGAPTCRRCVPEVELRLGRDAALGVRPDAPGSTAEAEIRLDARTFRLHPPAPGTGARSWTVSALDQARPPRHDDVHEVTR